jgi:hypothetical protein
MGRRITLCVSKAKAWGTLNFCRALSLWTLEIVLYSSGRSDEFAFWLGSCSFDQYRLLFEFLAVAMRTHHYRWHVTVRTWQESPFFPSGNAFRGESLANASNRWSVSLTSVAQTRIYRDDSDKCSLWLTWLRLYDALVNWFLRKLGPNLWKIHSSQHKVFLIHFAPSL